jgi:hypothetical protein
MMALPEWARKRLAELEATAPMKRTRKEDVFAIMPLWTAARVAEATRSPVLLVWARILYLWRKHSGHSFVLANDWLEQRGISRQSKYRILRLIEATGLISVEWRRRKSPVITVRL